MTQDRREPVFFIAILDNLTNDPWDRHNKSTGSPTDGQRGNQYGNAVVEDKGGVPEGRQGNL